MAYLDCYLVPVPLGNRAAYEDLARISAEVLRECGAVRIVECWLDEPGPSASSYHAETARHAYSEYLEFAAAAGAGPDDAVVVSYVEWRDKASRDAGMELATRDARMQFGDRPPVFDGGRLIAGGFTPMLYESDETARLNAELRRCMSGQTWFGPSLTAVLEGVDAATASRRAPGVAHSIWQIVCHLGVWARYAAYRFEGGVPRELDEDDWPPASSADDVGWASAREAMFAAYREAERALDAMTAERLDGIEPTTPVDADGEPVTLRRVAAGLAQHAAYHAGQIAIIKQLLADADAPA